MKRKSSRRVVFVLALVAVYGIARVTVIPLIRRALAARHLDEHARRPLMKLSKGVTVFAAVTVAFGLAEFGNFLTSLATIAAAATLAIGFAYAAQEDDSLPLEDRDQPLDMIVTERGVIDVKS